jgi:hypothetical protein
VQSCEAELQGQGFDYEYIFVANGDPKPGHDTRVLLDFYRKSSKVAEVIQQDDPLPPPRARQLGMERAQGEIIFLLDNHCQVWRDYFKRSMADYNHYGMDLLHSSYQYYMDEPISYHYTLRLAHNFWGVSNMVPPNIVKPFKIGVGGHGGFSVKRSTWEEVGGYGPEGLFVGYGGEEVYTDLKMWLLGKEVWLDPKVHHSHYAGIRGYPRHYTDAFYTNMMVCANVIGGAEWLSKVYDSFATPGKWIRPLSDKSMFDLMVDAQRRSQAHADELATKRKCTLDELLTWFGTESIVH